jgi:hypothetical protein
VHTAFSKPSYLAQVVPSWKVKKLLVETWSSSRSVVVHSRMLVFFLSYCVMPKYTFVKFNEYESGCRHLQPEMKKNFEVVDNKKSIKLMIVR